MLIIDPLPIRSGFETLQPIPLSARIGDQVIEPSPRLLWFKGPTLIDHLESVTVEHDREASPFRMPVQWVNRPNLDFRGFSGTVASGIVRLGDCVIVPTSGKKSTVSRIVTFDGDVGKAVAGQAVTLTLADEIDISRGDILADNRARPEVADQFAAHIIWMADEPLMPGRTYLFKIGTKTVLGSISEIKYQINVDSFEHVAAKRIELNEIAVVNLTFREPIAFDPYAAIHEMGAFIVIDRLSHLTVGAGMIDFALRRAHNIHWQTLDLTKTT